MGSNAHLGTLYYAAFQGYKVLIQAAISSGAVGGYTEKFLWDDRITARSRGTSKCSASCRALIFIN